MAGALAERVFVDKVTRAGFAHVRVRERRPFGLADAARYPLFTPEVVALMRALLPADRQARVATAVTLTAVKPE